MAEIAKRPRSELNFPKVESHAEAEFLVPLELRVINHA
jgi:hypothetical protein